VSRSIIGGVVRSSVLDAGRTECTTVMSRRQLEALGAVELNCHGLGRACTWRAQQLH
jgi:hypothetical protein